MRTLNFVQNDSNFTCPQRMSLKSLENIVCILFDCAQSVTIVALINYGAFSCI